MAHAIYSPSGADRWINCPGSILEQKKMKELKLDDRSAAAEEGTQGHTYCEHVLTDRLALDQVPENFRPHVAMYVNSIMADIDLGGEILGIELNLKSKEFKDLSGTPDCILRFGDCLVVVDFKYGVRNYVSPDATQLKIYGYLALEKFSDPALKRVELRVVQPRYVQEDVTPIRSHVLPAAELVEEMRTTIKAAQQAVHDTPEKRVVGDHCQWCPAGRVKGMPPCPAQIEQYQTILEAVPLEGPPLANMSRVDKVKHILDNKTLIKRLVSYAEEAAVELIEGGHKIPGYSTAPSLGNRKWAKDADYIEARLRRLGLTESQIWNKTLVSPAAAEKAGLKGEIDNLITREDRGRKLVTSKTQKLEEKKQLMALLPTNPLKENTDE